MSRRKLFICIPNNCGSTMFHSAFLNCKDVVGHPPDCDNSHLYAHTEYGAWVDLAMSPWTEYLTLLQNPTNYNWNVIEFLWRQKWKESKKFHDGTVLMCRAPDDICRIKMLNQEFPGSLFIVGTRNPYAASEGLRRRHGYDVERCALHFVRCMMLTVEAIETLPPKQVLCVKYEDLTEPDELYSKIESLLHVGDFKLDTIKTRVAADGKQHKEFADMNQKQLENLSEGDILSMNNIFNQYKSVLHNFGYDICKSNKYLKNTK